jgi:hypothetical protein
LHVPNVATPKFPNPGGLVAEAIGFHVCPRDSTASVQKLVETYLRNARRARRQRPPAPSVPPAPVDLGKL